MYFCLTETLEKNEMNHILVVLFISELGNSVFIDSKLLTIDPLLLRKNISSKFKFKSYKFSDQIYLLYFLTCNLKSSYTLHSKMFSISGYLSSV